MNLFAKWNLLSYKTNSNGIDCVSRSTSKYFSSVKDIIAKRSTQFRRVTPHKVSALRSVPSTIEVPPYVRIKKEQVLDPYRPIEMKSHTDIEAMRRVGVLARNILDYAGSLDTVRVLHMSHLS